MTGKDVQNKAAATVDLTNCDREPIHLLGRVQSYGGLVALSSDWIVQHASANLAAILGVSAADALGQPLSRLLVSDGYDRIRQSLRYVADGDSAVRLFGVLLKSTGAAFDVSLHQSGDHMIVEFEPKGERAGHDLMGEVHRHVASLRGAKDLGRLAARAADALRALSGFDSVMVYQFQPDRSGRVIAESRADGQPRYNGMMFPASDIPAQARTLYMRSLLRLIADVNDPGSPIEPGFDLAGRPIDLSLAVTRAVSPIHIEYLRNMGVEASMSVSIMKDGELWGLFACHHRSPRYIDYERRTAVEMFAHMFAYELGRQEDGQRKQAEAETGLLQIRLMAQMAGGQSLTESLLEVSREIRRVIPHDGFVLYQDETIHTTGTVPSEEEVVAIARMLDRSFGASVFASDQLGRIHEPARDYAHRVAGLMAIPISRRPRDYLMLFRAEVETTVNWAGDPTKPVTVGPNGARLTPRKSFDVWRETVQGRSAPWRAEDVHAAELLRTVLLEVFLRITDQTNEERKRALEQQQLLVSELNHRVRNILTLMRGLLAQSRSSARSLEEFTANLDGRIQALARAHDQLTAEKWEPASLRALITFEFAAYADGKADRVTVEGNDVLVKPAAYTTLALVLHEMATNSIKYGALCDHAGRVEIALKTDRSGGVILTWVERGGPPVTPPKRRGFGSMIIESSIPHELKGDATVEYKVTGLEARFRLPPSAIDSVVHTSREVVRPEPARPASGDDTMQILQGTALVLEDTLIIAMDAASMLEELGASEVKIHSGVGAALKWLEDAAPSFALLDVNLGAEQSLPVAEMLHARGVPFVLVTGYGEARELVEAYPPCIVLQKPFTLRSVETAVAAALKG